jgi:hypothetical protein
MPLPPEFCEQLPQRTDRELIEMLLQEDDYLPEALAAATEELRKRNLTPRRLDEIKAEIKYLERLAANRPDEDAILKVVIHLLLKC